VFKETPAEELVQANSHARLSCLKQLLLNVVVFIWFSDEDLFTPTAAEIFKVPDCTRLLHQKTKMPE